MVIGIDASRANKPLKTGVEWYSYHVIQQLKKIDSENRYFLYTNKSLTGALAKNPVNFNESLLRWPPVRLWTLLRLSYEMKFGRNKPHVLFVPAHTIPLLTAPRTVVTVHDIGFERFPSLYKWPDRLYHRWTIKWIKKNADAIMTVSEFSKREIMDVYGISSEMIHVVPNGYDSAVYYRFDRNVKPEIEEKYGIDRPYMMFIGRLEAKKNIVRLVESFIAFKKKNSTSRHILVLVGKRGYGFDEAEVLIANAGMEDAVKRLNWVPDTDVATLLNGADLFVFPSLYEGFGIPILEAMACGTPVICSNTTALPEVAGDAAVKFNPEKVDAIVKAMETVLNNSEVAVALTERGLDHVNNFSWEETARRTLTVLTQH